VVAGDSFSPAPTVDAAGQQPERASRPAAADAGAPIERPVPSHRPRRARLPGRARPRVRQPALLSQPEGRKYRTADATRISVVNQKTQPKARLDASRWTSTPGRSRNGAFRPSPTCSSR
jgi:hypothetical protein